jgi:hypothetical protein
MTKHDATTALWISGVALVGLLAAGCNPSPHIDPPGSGSGTGGTGGSGGTTSTTTTDSGGGGTTSTSSSTGGSGPGGCASNADCAYPDNLCDVASGQCVECITNDNCGAKPGTVCSKASCVCPTAGEDFCAADGNGSARCVDLVTSGADCGTCGHQCFGSCAASKCTDAWEPTAKVGAPSARTHHVAIWTGTKMIVWGGSDGGSYLGDGAMYDPDKRTWTPMSNANAPSPRDGATAIWDGTKMVVWGGHDGAGPLANGKAFDPAAGANGTWSNLSETLVPGARWQHTAVWTGNPTTRMIVWGGFDGGTELSTGGYYTSADAWFDLNAAGPPPPRRLHTAVWDDSNGRMIVFGGLGLDPNSGLTTSLNTGGIYGPLPGNEAWIDLGQVGSPPAPRYEHTAIWASTYMVVWGGQNNALGLLDDGGRFDVNGQNEWSAMNGTPPSPRRRHTAVYFKALSRMVVWGGYGPGSTPLDDGGVFDTSGGGTWVDTGVPKGPAASVDHTAIVAGSRMIIWGGTGAGGGVTNKGAVLDMTKVP